ncbi:anhydro-N-acetylmuramic acid kinase [Salinibacter ruber]|uniref:anhydro-N-acetylmuramic acid kinase n=1 Tax=Salinibacter ruber TaxID=146919 RepID=UPI0021690C3E|nr:anhydro-N-acetylmuramic acid kinase [Salinibacter ruber]MCS3649436.1 anhydro-N-acetylmuramic acid kinase [Salinibacter ruber]MCS3652690.1 anhydro-N-acetylmuramic acid kinase [Salinibacter ruber]
MDALLALHRRSRRTVVGLMSGTSLDGVDAALVQLDGSGPDLTMDPEAFVHIPYPTALRDLIRANTDPASSSVQDVTRLDARLAEAYAAAVDRVAAEADVDRGTVDLVGAHGQTVCHLPEPADCAGKDVRATLQLGNPSTLATRLGVPVVGNFRAADLALGGQGAPLVPYFDRVAFTAPDEARGLLNLGGIANLTVLPAGAAPDDVRAFDTGPANMVIDALAARLFDAPHDPDGRHADAGTPDHDLLADLLEGEYFRREPPKSTGRNDFGPDYVDRLLGAAQSRTLSPEDTMATATLLTAASVYQAYAQYVRPEQAIDELIVSGGGVHNDTLLRMLEEAFTPIPVRPTSDYGVAPDAKEALCFAVLAHEAVNGTPTNLPSVTGASARTPLGSLSVPGP